MLHKKMRADSGFTLIELLVSVALMVILTGAVVQIFVTSSDVFNSAEARISIYQNGRAALQKMSTEVAGAFSYEGSAAQEFCIDNMARDTTSDFTWRGQTIRNSAFDAANHWRLPTANEINDTIDTGVLSFITTTSWVDSTTPATPVYRVGSARVAYRVFPRGNRFVLQRCLYAATAGAWAPLPNADNSKDTKTDICQYLARFGTNCRLIVQYRRTTAEDTFLDNDIRDVIPVAIRVIMDVTDDFNREIRTITRTMWIPAGG